MLFFWNRISLSLCVLYEAILHKSQRAGPQHKLFLDMYKNNYERKFESMEERKEKNKARSKRGITLIALIITVVIMLILAGVAISSIISDNGLFAKIGKAKEEYEIASEREMLELTLFSSTLDLSEYNIGKKLYDRTIENSNKWDVVYDYEKDTVYGTNWNYIEKNTNIEDYGNTKYNWVVNNKTNEIILLKEENYRELSYLSSVGVTENLIFNIDSSIISNETEETIGNVLGENVELRNFNWTEESGLTSSSFNFDGIDDYIKIRYDNEEEKNTLAQNGFTFEFYGILNPGKSYDATGTEIDYSFKGVFSYGYEDEINKAPSFRFGTHSNYIKWNAGFFNIASDFSENVAPWNMIYDMRESVYGKEIYYTITLDTSRSYEKDGEIYYYQTLYVNGEIKYEGGYNKKSWDDFINTRLDDLTHFYIGKSTMGHTNWWHYMQMNAYTFRLYNRALTAEEVKENYDVSVAYHNLLF